VKWGLFKMPVKVEHQNDEHLFSNTGKRKVKIKRECEMTWNEMTSEMKKYKVRKAESVPVYQSYRRGEKLRWKRVMKEICFKLF
jgi:glutathione peroxidase-family protein